jgi:glycosyltransferase involved in cell wall biosynthesis
MKIAFVSQPFDYVQPPVQAGSIGIWTYQMMQAAPAKQHAFIVYAKQFPNQQAFETHDGIAYRRFSTNLDEWLGKPFRLLELLLNFPRSKKPFYATRLSYLGYIAQIARDLRTQQCDVVHVHNYSQFVPVLRAFNPKIKIVLHMHCEWLSDLDRNMIAARLQKTDLVLGCSDYIAEKVRLRFPQYADRVRSVYNGVDLRYFSSAIHAETKEPKKPKRLLYVGRVSPEKGLHTLLQAFEIVIKEMPGVQLDMVGPAGNAPYEYMALISEDPRVAALSRYYHGLKKRGDYQQELKGQLSPEVSSHVQFVGQVPHAELLAYYRAADLLVNPSLSEAFGMSLIEAMASKVPVVATRVGGMTEITENGRLGLLAEAEDAAALAQAILTLLADEQLRRQLGEAGYQRAAALYSWERVAESLVGLYASLGVPEK